MTKATIRGDISRYHQLSQVELVSDKCRLSASTPIQVIIDSDPCGFYTWFARVLIPLREEEPVAVLAEDLKSVMAKKTDEELYDVLYANSGDYTTDAVEIAKQEFNSRNIDASKVSGLGTVVEAKKKLEESPLEWPLRILAFFITPVALGIPIMLAHRNYVEQGANRKAHEWTRCAMGGFSFYVVVFALLSVISHRH